MSSFRAILLALTCLGTAGAAPAADKEVDRPRGTIVFASQEPRGWDVYVTDVNAGATTKLADHPAFDFNAAVSLPRTDEPFGELFVIRLDGTGLTRLTHNGFSEGTPEWGPPAAARCSGLGVF